jgi:hypothetical protein
MDAKSDQRAPVTAARNGLQVAGVAGGSTTAGGVLAGWLVEHGYSIGEAGLIVGAAGTMLAFVLGVLGSWARDALHRHELGTRVLSPFRYALAQRAQYLGSILLALALCSCAAARISPDGAVSAWAIGTAKVERCVLDTVAQQPMCTVVSGGPLSEGLLGSITGLIRGLLPAALGGGS